MTPTWQRIAIPLVLFIGAAVLLLANIDEPSRIYFDETYYVDDARDYLDQGVEASFAVHPPVGKWIIGASISVFGDDAFGWRAFGALSGALIVVLAYFIGLRLFRRTGPAVLAALLVLTDGLFIAQARITMLDIYLALFVTLGVFLLLVDRDRTEPVAPVAVPAGGSADAPQQLALLEREGVTRGTPRETMPRRRHPWRWLAGVAFGLAIATKWSGLLPWGAAGLLVVGWELVWRRRATGRWFAGFHRAIASILVSLVLIPIGVYTVSYVPWLVNYEHTTEGDDDCPGAAEGESDCAIGPFGRLAGLWRYQDAMLGFHLNLEATHSYRAPAYTWPVLARPVVYYWEKCTEERASQIPQTDEETGEVTIPEPCIVDRGEAGEILAVGNPALWWTFLAALPLLAAGAVRRDGRAAVIALFWGAQYLPWLVISRPLFLFYMTPNIVFLALGVAYAVRYVDEGQPLLWPGVGTLAGAAAGFLTGLGIEGTTITDNADVRFIALAVGAVVGAALGAWLTRRRPAEPPRWPVGTWIGAVVAVAAAGLFIYFYPVWTGIPLEEDAIRQRWWFDGWI
ncbi:MAG: phospholipid carrier-dependent glycosyltransferase [Nitriliruptorales bacterium]|nr:phospholipid carrier-dependent glycosyltransferase [Nitriliruptorales bacterium]